MADEKKVFDDTNVQDDSRNENLHGGKSTKAHTEEAKMDKQCTESHRTYADRQPDELKSTKQILPQDAERKSELSSEQST